MESADAFGRFNFVLSEPMKIICCLGKENINCGIGVAADHAQNHLLHYHMDFVEELRATDPQWDSKLLELIERYKPLNSRSKLEQAKLTALHNPIQQIPQLTLRTDGHQCVECHQVRSSDWRTHKHGDHRADMLPCLYQSFGGNSTIRWHFRVYTLDSEQPTKPPDAALLPKAGLVGWEVDHESLADLSPFGLLLILPWRMLCCVGNVHRSCGIGISSDTALNHLKDHHSSGLESPQKRDRATQLASVLLKINALGDDAKAIPSTVHTPPITFLNVIDGFCCNLCHECFGNDHTFRTHRDREHTSAKSEAVKLHVFHSHVRHRWFFRVEVNPSNRPPLLELTRPEIQASVDALHAFLKAIPSKPEDHDIVDPDEDPNLYDRSIWLVKTGWDILVKNCNVLVLCSAVDRKHPWFDPLKSAVSKYFLQQLDGIRKAPGFVLDCLSTKDSSLDKLRQIESSTVEGNYSSAWTKLLQMLLVTTKNGGGDGIPNFPLHVSNEIIGSIQVIRNHLQSQSPISPDTLHQIMWLLLSSYDHLDLVDNVYSSIFTRFMCLNCIQLEENGSWRFLDAKQSSPRYAAFKWGTRAIILRQWHQTDQQKNPE